LVFTASLLDVQYFKDISAEIKPSSSLVMSLGKALNGIATTFEWFRVVKQPSFLVQTQKYSPEPDFARL